MLDYAIMILGYQCKGQGVKNALFSCIFTNKRRKVIMDNRWLSVILLLKKQQKMRANYV